MNRSIHFISGLPRSGSTLLAALLRQNPALHAGITSPVSSMLGAMLAEMSAGNEGSVFFDTAQRAAVLRGLFDNYYHAIHPSRTPFDTSRGWTARIDLLARLFPEARMICCVRPIPWIIDSVERLLRRNPFQLSKIFGFEQGGTVYSRADGLMSPAAAASSTTLTSSPRCTRTSADPPVSAPRGSRAGTRWKRSGGGWPRWPGLTRGWRNGARFQRGYSPFRSTKHRPVTGHKGSGTNRNSGSGPFAIYVDDDGRACSTTPMSSPRRIRMRRYLSGSAPRNTTPSIAAQAVTPYTPSFLDT